MSNECFLEVLGDREDGKLRNLGVHKINPKEVIEVSPSGYGPGFSSVRMKDKSEFTIFSSDAYKINRLDE